MPWACLKLQKGLQLHRLLGFAHIALHRMGDSARKKTDSIQAVQQCAVSIQPRQNKQTVTSTSQPHLLTANLYTVNTFSRKIALLLRVKHSAVGADLHMPVAQFFKINSGIVTVSLESLVWTSWQFHPGLRWASSGKPRPLYERRWWQRRCSKEEGWKCSQHHSTWDS